MESELKIITQINNSCKPPSLSLWTHCSSITKIQLFDECYAAYNLKHDDNEEQWQMMMPLILMDADDSAHSCSVWVQWWKQPPVLLLGFHCCEGNLTLIRLAQNLLSDPLE